MSWETVRKAFEADGALRDIYVFNTSLADWDKVIGALPGWGYEWVYSLDGRRQPLPESSQELLAAWVNAVPLLSIKVGNVEVNCHFFTETEIEFDVLPSQVEGESEFEQLMRFIQRLGRLLGCPVSLTLENMREDKIVSYEPETDELEFHEVD